MQRIAFIPASVFSGVETCQIGEFTAAPIVVGLVRVMDAPNFYDIRDFGEDFSVHLRDCIHKLGFQRCVFRSEGALQLRLTAFTFVQHRRTASQVASL